MGGRQPVLIVIQGPEPGIIYRLPENRVTTVGRSTRNSIVVVNPDVSRFHCELSYVNGRWELHDLNSKKGTIINGEPLDGSRRLTPGDIVRMSSAVFRFDMVDESLDQDGALLAIKEAELDARLTRQKRKAEWLDEVMTRNRLDSQDEGEEGEQPYSVAASALLVAVVAVVVAAGVFSYLHSRRPAVAAAPAPALAARTAYTDAVKVLDAGKTLDAIQKLRAVQKAYPSTEEADRAAQKLKQAHATVLDQQLEHMAELEAAGDYAGALKARAELKQLDLGPAADSLLSDQDDLLHRLARAAYTSMDKTAQQRLQDGDREGALKLYRHMRDSVGIPELSAQADAKIKQLESNG